jgi:hypothetical protein
MPAMLAGDRDGGDLGAAAAGDRLIAGGEVGMPLGLLRGLAQDPGGPGDDHGADWLL